MIEIHEILAMLPHDFPFLLVDRIVEFEPEKRIVGIKNVTFNEPFFPGHFPGKPIMPAVLIIEALAQTGGILAFKSLPHLKGDVRFIGIDKARFRRQVVPGDTLDLEVRLGRLSARAGSGQGTASVGGQLACATGLFFVFAEA